MSSVRLLRQQRRRTHPVPLRQTQVVHNYETIPGAVPIPATLSLELGKVISEQQQNIVYRFVSDYPFKNRAPHQLDSFEVAALASLRANPDQKIEDASHTLFSDRVRLVAPIVMGAACVSCHNSHPESPKKDWKVGDVRGIQEVIIAQPIAANILSFKYLLAYFALTAICGISFLAMQRRKSLQIMGMNKELEANNDFLAALSMKISRYICRRSTKAFSAGRRTSRSRPSARSSRSSSRTSRTSPPPPSGFSSS